MSSFLERAVDWGHLRRVTHRGTQFLDDAVTMSAFPFPEIEEKQKGLRNIGLGIMGFAEMLIQMGVAYGSEPSLEIARQVMGYINRESKLASHRLAEERGPFEGWAQSKYARPLKYADWFRQHTGLDPEEWPDGLPLRNHHTTTIAPTGTTSMIANTSSGCEPLFDVAYFKNVGEDIQGQTMLVEFDDYFLRVLQANDVDVEAVKSAARRLMRRGEFEGPHSLDLPEAIISLFRTADKVSPEEHVRMQAAFQEHVDSAISKTINLPIGATREDVDAAYRLAIDLGCKGLTVYRLGSREMEVLQRSDRQPSTSTLPVAETALATDAPTVRLLARGPDTVAVVCPTCGSFLVDSE